MEVKVYDVAGKEVGSVKLETSVFGVKLNEDLVHRALVLQQANRRIATAHTKTRGEVRGSTRKLFRQKGTGRARAGSNRSPIRVGGGVAFGPRNNRNFTLSMNRKERQKAIFCLLSVRAKEKSIVVVDSLDFGEIKTKKMFETMQALPVKNKALVVLEEKNENIQKSTANLKNAKTLLVNYLNVADLLKFDTLVLSKKSVDVLNAMNA